MLDADREPDEPFADATRMLLLGRELRMGRRRRVDGQAAGVADIGNVVVHLQCIDETPAGRQAALQLEAHQPATATLQICLRPAILGGIGMHSGIDDPGNLAPLGEKLRHGLGVAAMLAHAQRQASQGPG